jgi:hypothetical protein
MLSRAFHVWAAVTAGLLAVADHNELRQSFVAVTLMPNGLTPRYYVDSALPLALRDGEDTHSCRDVGAPDISCPNDQYCYITDDGDPRCCPLGVNCANSECNSESYVCFQTAISPTGTAPTSTASCCPRSCPSSAFLCAPDLGGGCCRYGNECFAISTGGGGCRGTVSESPTSTPPLLTPIPSGCTTSQFSCTDGLGCCDNGQVCTMVTGQGFCAAGTPTGTGITLIPPDELDNSSADLSEGAKAGIAIGAVVGAGAIIGLITWFCIGRRRQRRRQSASQQSGPVQQGMRLDAAQLRNVADPAMTEYSNSSRPRPGRGLTQDYFGPAAVAGPYTETVPSTTASPGYGPDRAVPTRPQAPGDIAAPVEIDSKDGPLTPRSMSQASGLVSLSEVPAHESIQGRFELHGSEGPSPPERPSPFASPTLGHFERPPSRQNDMK